MSTPDHPPHDPLEGQDADGTIVTGARRATIQPAFWPVLQQAIDELQRMDRQCSLYVYGSVATGRARVGRSDIDLITVGLDAQRAQALAGSLAAAHPGSCRGVEIGPAQPADHEGPGDQAYGNRVFMRHYTVHLCGPDGTAALPRYAADAAAARGFNGDIGLRAAQWRAELDAPATPTLARRMARKTLFAVAGLVSLHDARWTTDRVAAARRWAAIQPEWAEALATLVDWGFDPLAQPSRDEIRAALDGVVSGVVADFSQRIGLWRPEPERRASG